MGKRIALNVLYNLGIIISLFVAYEGIITQHFSWIVGAVFIGTILVLLKLRLLKEVREMNKKR